jgi:hypothetical protein
MYDLNCERYICYCCGIKEPPKPKGKKYRALIETHHIIEQNEGGSNGSGNLVRLCGNCHSKVHLGVITLDKYYDCGFCRKLKWVDEHHVDQFGPTDPSY